MKESVLIITHTISVCILWCEVPCSVFFDSPRQLVLVQLRNSRRVFFLDIGFVEETRTPVFSEKLCTGSVPADFHCTELVELPGIEIGRSDERNVDAHVTVGGGTVEADVDAKGDAGPGRVSGIAVKA